MTKKTKKNDTSAEIDPVLAAHTPMMQHYNPVIY